MTQYIAFDPDLDTDDEDLHPVELSAREWDVILTALHSTDLRTHSDASTIVTVICEQLPEELLTASENVRPAPNQSNVGNGESDDEPTIDEIIAWLSGDPGESSTTPARTPDSTPARTSLASSSTPIKVCSACGSDQVFYDAFIGVNDASDTRTFPNTHCDVCDGPTSLTTKKTPTGTNWAVIVNPSTEPTASIFYTYREAKAHFDAYDDSVIAIVTHPAGSNADQ